MIRNVASTVHRKLTFYAWKDALKRESFDRVGAARAVKDLEGKPDSVVEIDGTLVTALVTAVGNANAPTRFQLLPLRDYDNRPLRFRLGSDLAGIRLNRTEYTSDVAHVVVWPDNYAAYDAHGFAPGPTRLAAYLEATTGERVEFLALYDRDQIEYLKSLDGLTAVEFSITSSDKARRAVASRKGVFRGFRATREIQDDVSFATKISVGRKRGEQLDRAIQEDVLDLADRADRYFDSIRVSGIDPDTKKTVELNLLQTKLHVPVDLPRATGGGNAPNTTRCFSELEKAKKLLGQDKLEAALRARGG